MATVTALQSFVGILKNDKLGPPRIEKHSQFPEPSVFPGKVIEEGEKIQVQKGDNFDSNHPAVKKWPSMFGQVELVHPTQQATTPLKADK
jgi:hypothetical protein